MRTISMTICTLSYKEEAFFQAELLHYSAATATYVEKKKNHTTGLDNIKKPDSINQFLSQVENVAL